jgi:hypothetical protein
MDNTLPWNLHIDNIIRLIRVAKNYVTKIRVVHLMTGHGNGSSYRDFFRQLGMLPLQ